MPAGHARMVCGARAIACQVGCVTALQKPACCIALKFHFRHVLSSKHMSKHAGNAILEPYYNGRSANGNGPLCETGRINVKVIFFKFFGHRTVKSWYTRILRRIADDMTIIAMRARRVRGHHCPGNWCLARQSQYSTRYSTTRSIWPVGLPTAWWGHMALLGVPQTDSASLGKKREEKG